MYTKIDGKFVKHNNKKHQLYHHQVHGYGFFDDLGQFVKKAYEKGK